MDAKQILKNIQGDLAAAQAAILTPAVVLKRLVEHAPLIGTVQRDLPARHQTLQATVAWSYDLLEPAEQAAFCCVGVGRTPFDQSFDERWVTRYRFSQRRHSK